MKKYLFTILMLAISITSYGAIISRTYTYTAGNTMTANENNTNENTLYNEINGNLDNTNIIAGGINNANIANNTITGSKIATTTSLTVYASSTTSLGSTSIVVTTLTATNSVGVATNTAAYAGNIGEVMIASTSQAMNNSSTTITSVVLTPGDWDLTGGGYVNQGGITFLEICLSTTTNSFAGCALGYDMFATNGTAAGLISVAIPKKIMQVSTNTTIYLVALQSGSSTVYGSIVARRVR